MKRVKVSMGKWCLRCLLIFTLVFSFVAALPIIPVQAAGRYGRKRIEILSTVLVIEPIEFNLVPAKHSQNFIAQLLDPLIGYEVREFKRVETIDLGRIPVTIEVTISSGSILVDLVGRDPEPDPAPEHEPDPEEAPAPRPVAGP